MQSTNALKKDSGRHASPRFAVTIATTQDEVRACQRLRYDIFSGEMNAQLETPLAGHDIDHFDDHCDHLYVYDHDTESVIATTRILTNHSAKRAGSYYSETEFDIKNVISAPAKYMEIGRTCVHPRYRRGVGLQFLWQGVANVMNFHQAQYLFGCVSIPYHDGGDYISNIMRDIRKNHYAPGYLRVTPRVPVASRINEESVPVVLPPLLRTYLKMGAVACGEPCLDEKFNVADIFILLNRERINNSFDKHFLGGRG